MVREERLLVVGDLHIGREFRLSGEGIHFPDASARMAAELMELYARERARGIVLLGDVKESIGWPERREADAIASFFRSLGRARVVVVRGNHDARLAEVLGRAGIYAEPVRELLLEKAALAHGNAMVSEAAMAKECIIAGHAHVAVDVSGSTEKGWLVAKTGPGAKDEYSSHNRRIRLVVMPAFSRLITGVRVLAGGAAAAAPRMPLLRRRVFDLSTATAYDLQGRALPLRK